MVNLNDPIFQSNMSRFISSLRGIGDSRNTITEEELNYYYVDPFNNNHGLNIVKNDMSTFIIGKKGSGKTTLLSKYIYDNKNNRNECIVYIDIKSIFRPLAGRNHEINEESIEIESYPERILDFYEKTFDSITNDKKIKLNSKDHDLLKSELISNKYELLEVKDAKSEISKMRKSTKNLSIGAKIGTSILKGSSLFNRGMETGTQQIYKNQNIEYIDPLKKLSKVKDILTKRDVNRIVFCLDDFSEITHESMKFLMEYVIAPLHNDSSNFFKFKICGYPNRIDSGTKSSYLSSQSINYLNLDFFERTRRTKIGNIFTSDINKLYDLIELRLSYYFSNTIQFRDLLSDEPESYLINNDVTDDDTEDNISKQIIDQIFYFSFNNPRLVGMIFNELNNQNFIYGEKITKENLNDAAIETFKQIRGDFFDIEASHFFSFRETLNISELEELYNSIIDKAIENSTNYLEEGLHGNIFFIDKKYESFLDSFELSYLIYKFREKNNNKKTMSFFTINPAICKDEDIAVKLSLLELDSYLEIDDFDITDFVKKSSNQII